MSYARAQIEKKIDLICKRLIKGKKSKDQKSVKWFYAHKFLSIIFVGGAGAPAFFPIEQMTKGIWVGLAFLLALIFEVYKTFQVEKTAIQALAAHEAFSAIEVELENALEEEDPMNSLIKIQEKVQVLNLNFHMSLPEWNAIMDTELGLLVTRLIDHGQGNWSLSESISEDRIEDDE